MYNSQESYEEVVNLFENLPLNTDPLSTQNSSWIELNNTGRLNIFKNQELKKSISDYYLLSKEKANNIEEHNNFSTQYLVEASRVIRNMSKFFNMKNALVSNLTTVYDDPKMILSGEWNFINEPSSDKFQALESLAFTYWYRYTEQLKEFKELDLNAIELSSKITEELELRE